MAPARFEAHRCHADGRDRNIEPHIIEACLIISGAKPGVAGIYNRAKYATQKKVALERWATHVTSLVTDQPGAKVLPMKRKRGR